MKNYLLAGISVVFLALFVVACDQQPAQIVQPAQQSAAPAPVVVQQSNDGFWEGMLLGHMFSSGPIVVHHYDNRPTYVAPRAPVVSNTTIINKTYVRPAPTPAARPSVAPYPAPRPTYSPPRVTSYGGAYSSRPSYSSYSSRSSYSSFSSSRR